MDSPLDFAVTVQYIELICLLKPSLRWEQASYQSGAPENLPLKVHDFLNTSLNLSDDIGRLAWTSLRTVAWSHDLTPTEELAARTKYIELFLQHGLSRDISIYLLEPPTRTCVDASCAQQLHANPSVLRDRELTEPLSVKITVFTKEFGSVPGFATSRYCRHCHTRYYPNYFVHSHATLRTYYQEGPQLLQIAGHFYADKELCELFSLMMVTSWTSATNCARTYNDGLVNQRVASLLPTTWPYTFQMDVEDAWNAFFLHNLIIDHHSRGETLELSHVANSQADRLRPALHARNARMAGTGQDAWNHVCDLCCWFKEEDGQTYTVRSTVTDGIAIGRPYCAVHDCLEPLPTVKHRYCNTHRSFNKQCVITNCKDDSDDGFRTCSIPEHRALESYHYLQGKAMFQLKHRLERLNVSQTHDSLSTGSNRSRTRMTDELDGDLLPDLVDGDTEDEGVELEGSGADADEDVEIDASGVCDGKPETGNRTVRARFGRRRTHNEQLCVGSCGVILGRATFYGSEAPNGVREFWMKLFPTKRSLPQVLWHDNNCRVVAMLRNDPDPHLSTYFDNCALPVDVFHFKCKHKETDVECGANCNPYLWAELRTEGGKWRFNSSAAEQTNAWFGGFQSMVREMQADRYDFFLDEMIRRRNISIIKLLAQKGKGPHSIPREELLEDFIAVASSST
ncbi:hypothetical protein B0H16DRAFT_1902481 [Mycena metata]|uniref:CxC5 like cysteine cluster associated with KDZ domain-containing protein n=1 Tax=Mycena metata TaxID=1033252 RepID=A0AAD7DYR0_9AGAR|nr:hypothetical protein B0H16DRAFT_1902481 [Mycena metata]